MLWPWSYFVEGDEGCIDPTGKLLCLYKMPNILQHMYGNIPYMFDCWADSVDHLILLETSMLGHSHRYTLSLTLFSSALSLSFLSIVSDSIFISPSISLYMSISLHTSERLQVYFFRTYLYSAWKYLVTVSLSMSSVLPFSLQSPLSGVPFYMSFWFLCVWLKFLHITLSFNFYYNYLCLSLCTMSSPFCILYYQFPFHNLSLSLYLFFIDISLSTVLSFNFFYGSPSFNLLFSSFSIRRMFSLSFSFEITPFLHRRR